MNLEAKLADAASYESGPPHALFARLRAEAPVCWHPGVFSWFIDGPRRMPVRFRATT